MAQLRKLFRKLLRQKSRDTLPDEITQSESSAQAANDSSVRLRDRTNELELEHKMPHPTAFSIAKHEKNVKENLPRWCRDNKLKVKIFLEHPIRPPSKSFDIPDLGISLSGFTRSGKPSKGYFETEAEITVTEPTVEALSKAISNLHLLLGLMIAAAGGGQRLNWEFPALTCLGVSSAASAASQDDVNDVLRKFLQLRALRPKVARHLRNSLNWWRYATSYVDDSVFDLHQRYIALWQAFESLIYALHQLRKEVSQQSGNGGEISNGNAEQRDPKEILSARLASLPDDMRIEEYCKSLTDEFGWSTFKTITGEALQFLLKPPKADEWIEVCFERTPKKYRLYQIRNDIAHARLTGENHNDSFIVLGGYTELFQITRDILRVFLDSPNVAFPAL